MSTIPEAAASVEAACASFLSAASPEQRGAAEAFLLQFRKHPQPLVPGYAGCRDLFKAF